MLEQQLWADASSGHVSLVGVSFVLVRRYLLALRAGNFSLTARGLLFQTVHASSLAILYLLPQSVDVSSSAKMGFLLPQTVDAS